jgi:predicted acetyltransferase
LNAEADYGPLRGEDELALYVRSAAWAFRAEEDRLIRALERIGTDRVRLVREKGRPVAGLLLYHLGQFWGGKAIPMGGVGLVAVDPESRGHGVATRLMEAALREMRETDLPISVLFPAKQTLYRRVGYELAGGRYRLTIPVPALAFGERDLPIRAIEEKDLPAIERTYRSHAAESNGRIERSLVEWTRIREPREKPTRGYLVEGPEGVDGYLYLREQSGEGHFYDLDVTDLVGRTRQAVRRLYRFLGDHASLAARAMWFSHPADPNLMLLPEQTYELKADIAWMLRIVDVKRAIEERPFPEGLRAELSLEVHDELLSANAGRHLVEIEGGRARVTEGGDGRLKTGPNGLASLYSGYFTPAALRVAGMIEGDHEDLRVAGDIFAGPAPWMPDMF